MNLLLDTHVFIWSKTDDPRMSSSAWSMLRDPGNQLFMSSISVAEMAIKSAIGKLSLDLPLDQFVTTGMRNGQIAELPLRSSHAIRLASLPLHHRDPFDRLLIATALRSSPLWMETGASLVSDDDLLERCHRRGHARWHRL